MNSRLLSFLLVVSLINTAWGDSLSNNGSIWGHTASAGVGASLFHDNTAHLPGDLVTIVVDLQNQVTDNQNTKTSKDTALTALLSQLLYPANGTSTGYNFLNNQGNPPNPNFTSSTSFNGGGTVANQQTLSSTIQARVVAVQPNGVLRLQAFRVSKAGQEDTSMMLSGEVRQEDLSTSNSVSSSRVSNLQIIQKGSGSLSRSQSKGWLTKLYEFLSPF